MNTCVANHIISAREYVYRLGVIVFSMALFTETVTAANRIDVTLAALRINPTSSTALAELRSVIPSVTNIQDRLPLGVIYCLGCLVTGNTTDGLEVRAQLLKAYPSDPRLSPLTTAQIFEKCVACSDGTVQIQCPKCGGTGQCSYCNGTGNKRVQRVGGAETIRCPQCAGGGKCGACKGGGTVAGKCTVCKGTAQVLAAERLQNAYASVLSTNGTQCLEKIGIPPSAPSAASASTVMGPRSRLLAQYAVTSNDLKRIDRELVTSVQKASALRELWARGWSMSSSAPMRLFFVRVPTGVKYKVTNVDRQAFEKLLLGDHRHDYCFFIHLEWEGLDQNPHPQGEPVFKDRYFSSYDLTQIRLAIPIEDRGVWTLNKGDMITSDEWFIPWALSLRPQEGNIGLDLPVFRSDKDLETLVREVPGLFRGGLN